MDSSGKVNLPPKPIIFFDGVCNLCNSAVDFIINKDDSEIFVFESLQSQNAQKVLDEKHLKGLDYILVLTPEREVLIESKAVYYISKRLKGWPRIIYYFRILPTFFSDFIYSIIASNRYRLFGKRDSCRMPNHELKLRFLEGYQNN